MMSFHVSVVVIVIDVVPLCWQHLSKYFLLRQPEGGEINESPNGSSTSADTVRANCCIVTSTGTSRLAQQDTRIVSYTCRLHAT